LKDQIKQKKTYILLTFDLEDWFQVENLKSYIPFSTWSERELRVEQNTYRLLDLLDSIDVGEKIECFRQNIKEGVVHYPASLNTDIFNPKPINPKPSLHPKATFFILGWLAERLPHLVREIHSRGHEVASHGYYHNLCYEQEYHELHSDLLNSKKLLEDIISAPIYGYRAPSFSIANETLKIIEECGYLYDSSYNSFGMHGRYGRLDIRNYQRNGISLKLSDSFYELPISNLHFSIFNLKSSIFNPVLPWGGGGYFRLIPYTIFKKGIEFILNKDRCYLFYMHPWEIDEEQPKINSASRIVKFKHYTNLRTTLSKLSHLIDNHIGCLFLTSKKYLDLECAM